MQQYLGARLQNAQFAQINGALFQNVNKKKFLVLKPSSRVVFERPLTKLHRMSEKNSKLDSVFKMKLQKAFRRVSWYVNPKEV